MRVDPIDLTEYVFENCNAKPNRFPAIATISPEECHNLHYLVAMQPNPLYHPIVVLDNTDGPLYCKFVTIKGYEQWDNHLVRAERSMTTAMMFSQN